MSSAKRVEPLNELAEWLDQNMTAEDHQRLWDIKQQYDWLPWPEYLAWCSYLTKDEPPSREITPPDAEPFVL